MKISKTSITCFIIVIVISILSVEPITQKDYIGNSTHPSASKFNVGGNSITTVFNGSTFSLSIINKSEKKLNNCFVEMNGDGIQHSIPSKFLDAGDAIVFVSEPDDYPKCFVIPSLKEMPSHISLTFDSKTISWSITSHP